MRPVLARPVKFPLDNNPNPCYSPHLGNSAEVNAFMLATVSGEKHGKNR